MKDSGSQAVMLLDGVCYLCDRSARFVVRHDSRHRFRLSHIQSPPGQALMRRYRLEPEDLSSFVLIENHAVYRKSEAWLRVMAALDWPWRAAVIFRIVPPFIRDAVYDWIGRNRYRWFGQSDQCLVPGPEIRDRFLQDEADA